MNFVAETAKRTGYLFYLMNPNDHNYKEIEDVKDYYKEVIPLFFVTVFMEQVIRYYQNKPVFKLNDTISNVSHGILMDISKIPFKGAEVWLYAWIYRNYHVISLPWDSPWTWLLAWILTDFCFYWMHRITHQVNILWTIHETHHTPEEMMLTAPMRNHIFLLPLHWLTYLPLALAIPPTTYLVHYQITIIFQYWLHSEVVDKMPAVIEYFFSTPSHHRVHHGRNRRYIDKNFGGFLIIWDRIFGTYEDEDKDEKPVYGTTKPIKSFNPLIIQANHFIAIWKKFWEMEGIENKLSVIFKGPGWSPGEPWTGNPQNIPDPPPRTEGFSPVLPAWLNYYTIAHFVIFLSGYMAFALNMKMLSKTVIYSAATFLAYSTIAFGFILDLSPHVVPVELVRCLLYLIMEIIIGSEVSKFGNVVIASMYVTKLVFVTSLFLWTTKISYHLLRKDVNKKSR